MSDVYVCILTWNRLEKVKACIESIMPEIDRMGARLFILDQGSDNGTWEWLCERFSDRRDALILGSYQNFKAIGGRQRQVDMLYLHSIVKTLVFLDSDVVAVKEEWLEQLVAPLENPEIGICGQYGRNLKHNGVYGFWPPDDVPCEVDVLSGGMTAVRMEVLRQGVEFDMEYLPFWHADSDLCMQIRDKGYKVWCTGHVGLEHEAEHRESDEIWKRNFMRLIAKWNHLIEREYQHRQGKLQDMPVTE